MPRPLTPGQRRTKRAEAQQRENELCALFGNWREPRAFHILPPSIGEEELGYEFSGAQIGTPTFVPNLKNSQRAQEFKAQKRRSRQKKYGTYEP